MVTNLQVRKSQHLGITFGGSHMEKVTYIHPSGQKYVKYLNEWQLTRPHATGMAPLL
jgi:hypothetical protein